MVSSFRTLLAEKQGIKTTTRVSYARLLKPILDLGPDNKSDILQFVASVSNPNTRRATCIALRSLGVDIRVPQGYARVYDLPDEETLRIVLSYSKYEVQFLTMMYLGLRIGEAAWVNQTQLMPGNRLFVDKQVAEWQDHGWLYEVREPKSRPAVIDVPAWLAARLPKTSNPQDPIRPYRLRAALHYTTTKHLGESLPCHALRHWTATELLRQHTPLPMVQRHMRHADIATTLRVYANFNERMSLFDDSDF